MSMSTQVQAASDSGKVSRSGASRGAQGSARSAGFGQVLSQVGQRLGRRDAGQQEAAASNNERDAATSASASGKRRSTQNSTKTRSRSDESSKVSRRSEPSDASDEASQANASQTTTDEPRPADASDGKDDGAIAGSDAQDAHKAAPKTDGDASDAAAAIAVVSGQLAVASPGGDADQQPTDAADDAAATGAASDASGADPATAQAANAAPRMSAVQQNAASVASAAAAPRPPATAKPASSDAAVRPIDSAHDQPDPAPIKTRNSSGKPASGSGPAPVAAQPSSDAQLPDASAAAADADRAVSTEHPMDKAVATSSIELLGAAGARTLEHAGAQQPGALIEGPAATPTATPEARFAEANHSQIVGSISGQLLPRGGTMHIHLDPPELGAMQVTVRMTDGAVTASFQTSNEQATQLLSHSLAQLKQVLETQGISVERLHVQQAPPPQHGSAEGERDGRGGEQQQSGQQGTLSQEQQRRELLRRMWRRLNKGVDPLDLVA